MGQELGRPEVVIKGVDLKLHDEPRAYRRAVAQIKYDPLSLGGLVTTHKIDLLTAARDMFDYLDPYAILCDEVSSISKRDGRLEGHAKDPISSGLSLDALVGEGYFARTGGEVLCFGAGDPRWLLRCISSTSQTRLIDRRASSSSIVHRDGWTAFGRWSQGFDTDIVFETICNQDPARNDVIMGALPPGSIVINATGMGKDRPGSPITSAGIFPLAGIAWEFNYRGELDFLHQALAQQAARKLRVEDGWVYFLHGWTQVIAQVFHLSLDGALFNRLAAVAESIR